ncbi:MAG: hypothetical protein KBB71_01475 [Lentimicrobiaceae bacterium]|nr:hypothetical protein [Lentimicrobiaceae bacterium]
MKSIRPTLLLVILINGLWTTAQDINSPYSNFGVGNLFPGQTSVNTAMGGIGIGLQGNSFINIMNPASYGFFDSTSFILQGGILADAVKTQSENISTTSRNVQLGYMLFGFPIAHWLKSSIGLTPFSRVGYLIYNDYDQDSVGRITNQYQASGGLNRAHIGLAIRPFRNLSVGVNANFLFGDLDYQQIVDFPDSAYIYSFRVIANRFVQDFMFEVGAQYTAHLSPSLRLTAGAVYELPASLNTKRYLLAETFIPALNNVDNIYDTIVYQPDQKGTIELPQAFGGGFTLENPNRWTAGVDVYWQQWEDFRSFSMNDSLDNSLRVAAGGQFRPSLAASANYAQKIQYRFGFHYNKTSLKLRGTQINEIGLTFGAGLPLKGIQSMVNLAVEIGQRGTTSNGLLKENYVRLSLGISIYERWFIRSKFY